MPFFLRKKRKGEKSKSNGPKGKKSKALDERAKRRNFKISEQDDEELSTDEEDGMMEEIPSDEDVEPQSETDSEAEKETAQEKRLRIAKEYLSQVEAEIDDAAESDEDADGLMDQRLQHDAKKVKGKHFVPVADNILEPQPSDIIVLRGHQLALTCLVISPDNKFIYTGSKDCSIIKWDLESKRKVKVVPGGRKGTEGLHKGHTSHVLSMAISNSGKYLVTGDQTTNILVWNPDNMELIHRFKGHKGAVTSLAFRRESHELFSGSADKMIKVWSLDEMSHIETVYGHTDTVQSLDAMYKERAVSVGGRDNTVRLWKIVEESQLVFNGPGGSLDCVCLIDEEKFVTGSDANEICLWKTLKKWPVAKVTQAHEGDDCWISALRALRNTDLLASGSRTGQIKLWKMPDRGSLVNIHSIPIPGFINDIQFSMGGKFLAAAVGQEHKLGRWWKLKDAKNCLVIVYLPRKPTKSILTET